LKASGVLQKQMQKNLIHYNKMHLIYSGRETANATQASYIVLLLVAKTGKHHAVGENLMKPTALGKGKECS
jgi:hypothetical protein